MALPVSRVHAHTHTHRCGIKSIAPFHSLSSESLSLPELLLSFPGTGQPGPAGQDWGFLAPALSLCNFFLQSATAQLAKNPSASAGGIRDVSSVLGQEDPLEKRTATHFSILPWRIPWMEKLGSPFSPWIHKESYMIE